MALPESTIAQCLRGRQSFSHLEAEALSAIERVSETRERIHVVNMPGELVVTREMLVFLCDAADASTLSPAAVRIVAFAMVASDYFTWSDDLVGEVLHDWAAPEVNLALSSENLQRFRRWLTGNEAYPHRTSTPAAEMQHGGRVISELERVAGRARQAEDVVARVCALPQQVYSGGRTVEEVVHEIAPALHQQPLTIRAVRRWLRRHPDAIEWWERWSEDKRTSSGWYFIRGVISSEVGRYDSSGGRQQVRRFLSPARACAQFVMCEMTELTRRR